MLLKGAESLEDVRFTIVGPSWSREMLQQLFEAEQVSEERFEIITPQGKPYALRCFELWSEFRSASRKEFNLMQRSGNAMEAFMALLWKRQTTRAVSIYNPMTLLLFLCEVVTTIALLLPLGLLVLPLLLSIFLHRLLKPLRIHLGKFVHRFSNILISPQSDAWVLRLYDEMQRVEVQRMQKEIDEISGIRAWYCPTAFWPSFNNIKAPRLMCVPDVVLADFPVGFSSIGGDQLLKSFEKITHTIREGDHFITYSDSVKWETLVDRHLVSASKVSVIQHAPSDLSRWIKVNGLPDAEASCRHYCQTLLLTALQRSTNPNYSKTFYNGNVQFLFYASQFRPNKNVLTLLRAYEYLLRKRYITHKLFLTGNPAHTPEVGNFVLTHRLENDVLFLPGLSAPELAACYKLASLAVNPSLSEGGCPFTFTEALSVDTPVVMARIPVAEEVLTAPELQEVTFFDPYDWQDLASRIEWALENREELLKVQRKTYAKLSKRTWTDVAAEYLHLLDHHCEHTALKGPT